MPNIKEPGSPQGCPVLLYRQLYKRLIICIVINPTFKAILSDIYISQKIIFKLCVSFSLYFVTNYENNHLIYKYKQYSLWN